MNLEDAVLEEQKLFQILEVSKPAQGSHHNEHLSGFLPLYNASLTHLLFCDVLHAESAKQSERLALL